MPYRATLIPTTNFVVGEFAIHGGRVGLVCDRPADRDEEEFPDLVGHVWWLDGEENTAYQVRQMSLNHPFVYEVRQTFPDMPSHETAQAMSAQQVRHTLEGGKPRGVGRRFAT